MLDFILNNNFESMQLVIFRCTLAKWSVRRQVIDHEKTVYPFDWLRVYCTDM